jgi:HEAT repeat protein
VDSIIPFLNSGSFKIKQAAVCALGSLENPKACPFLLNLFEDDENENIIEDIKDALLKTLNKKDVAALAQAVLYLKDPRLWVKKTCLQVIAKTAEPSLNQFIEPVTQSPVKELRDLALKIINS